MTQFYGKTKICYGGEALENLERLPGRKAFIVTDAIMVRTGFIQRVRSHLERAGMPHAVFDAVEPDPSLETVTAGVTAFLAEGADVVIALGGGSPIDTAKAIVHLARRVRPDQPKPLLVAIPTTSGTGSEVTAIAVITDRANGVKIPLNDEDLIPDVALLDARFTRTLPPGVTAATGMDVLTHAIEAYTARSANAFTSIYAEQAVLYVFLYLLRAFEVSDDMEARKRMQLASCMAGMAFNNSGLGITHSMAHSLGGVFHIPHGVANAVMLPHVIRYNSFDAGPRYRNLAAMLTLPAATVEEGVASLVGAVRNLNAALGLAGSLRELGVERAAFDAALDTMAANTLEDICTAENPRLPSAGDIKILLEAAW